MDKPNQNKKPGLSKPPGGTRIPIEEDMKLMEQIREELAAKKKEAPITRKLFE